MNRRRIIGVLIVLCLIFALHGPIDSFDFWSEIFERPYKKTKPVIKHKKVDLLKNIILDMKWASIKYMVLWSYCMAFYTLTVYSTYYFIQSLGLSPDPLVFSQIESLHYSMDLSWLCFSVAMVDSHVSSDTHDERISVTSPMIDKPIEKRCHTANKTTFCIESMIKIGDVKEEWIVINEAVTMPLLNETTIDNLEDLFLSLGKKVMKKGIISYLEICSKIKAKEVLSINKDVEGIVVANSIPYRVDGEIGRLEFTTYRVDFNDGTSYNTATEYFTPLGSREYFRTVGFNELALSYVQDESYRKAAEKLNRARRETEEGGTPSRTLAYIAEKEGSNIQEAMDHIVQEILLKNNFDKDGSPIEENLFPIKVAEEEVSLPKEEIAEAIKEYNQGKEGESRIDEEAASSFYENPQKAVNISIDEVGVKKQKEQRTEQEEDLSSKDANVKKNRVYVRNTIAHLEHKEKKYIINGSSIPQALKWIIAFLLKNQLVQGFSILFFVDGAQNIHNGIARMFAWLPKFQVILDWFHLKKKCIYELSLSVKGNTKQEILKRLLPLLWLGKINAAIAYLKSIDKSNFKKNKNLDRLIQYLERNQECIPCYALRKKLGLRNSSNKGEKENDLCVSDRQKDNGMSWSKTGSVALASITALHRNHEQKQWISSRSLRFSWAA